jgi:hypothetical protein
MRKEAAAIVLGILIAAAVLVVAFRGYRYPPRNGFGPDWDCAAIPDAPVCIKKLPPTTPPP